MAITLITRDFTNNIDLKSEVFAGRVLRVEQVSETRNWSDTMDYTDFRTTQCTYALVWLGTHNLPPSHISSGRPKAHWGSVLRPGDELPDYLKGDFRELEYFEQFAWVDCTNLHGDRTVVSYVDPTTDAVPYSSDEPLMWANFIAWEAYMKALGEKKLRDQESARLVREKASAEAEAKDRARVKAKADREEASKVAAEAMLVTLPEKGVTLTVGGFTGVVFWRGTTKYRGKWSARVGVRNAKGEVEWVDGSTIAV